MSQRDRPTTGVGPSSWLLLPVLLMTVFAGITAFMPGRKKRKKQTLSERLPRSMEDPRVRQAVLAAQQAYVDARGRIDVADAQAFGEDVAKRVATLIETSKTGIPPLSREMSQRARVVADRLREEGTVRGTELGERLKTDVAPAAKVWANEALEEAEEILANARERAGDFSETARKSYVPVLSSKASAMGGALTGSAAGAAQMIGKRAGQVKPGKKASKFKLPQVGRQRISGIRKQPSVIQRSTSRAGGALQKAGSTTKYAATESVLIVFWLGALGAVIYYGLLNPELRERVANFLTGAMDQIQDVARDFQSDDDEFPVSNG